MEKLKKLLLPRELAIIEAFRRSVPAVILSKVDRQLEAVGVVQHEVGGYDCNFYSKKLFGAKPLDCEPFSGMGDEVHVATFCPGNNPKYAVRAKLWFVRGKIFSLEFKGRPLADADSAEWQCEIFHPLGDQ